MEKLKICTRGGVVRIFRTRGVLCEFHTTLGVVRKFRTSTIHPPFCNFEARSNGENFWLLRVGNAG